MRVSAVMYYGNRLLRAGTWQLSQANQAMHERGAMRRVVATSGVENTAELKNEERIGGDQRTDKN